MDLTFLGFPIGRVRRVELAPEGSARIVIDVPRKDAHWLRTSSMFTLVRSLVGGASLRAYSGVLTDPPLPAGAERPVLSGDATAELPQLVSATRELVANLGRLTAAASALAATLLQLQSTTERLNGRQGALGVLMGNEADARQVVVALERSNALLARLEALTAHTDQRLYGPGGLMQDTQATVQQMHGLLVDARASLKKADAILVDLDEVLEDPWWSGDLDIAEMFVHRAKGHHVASVVVGGKVVIEDRRFKTIDVEALWREVRAVCARGLPPAQKEYAALMDAIKPHAQAWYARWQRPFGEPYYRVNARN